MFMRLGQTAIIQSSAGCLSGNTQVSTAQIECVNFFICKTSQTHQK